MSLRKTEEFMRDIETTKRTNMNRPSSPTIKRLKITKEGFAFEVDLRCFEYSTMVPATTSGWLLMT
jgi:hypothetical protein